MTRTSAIGHATLAIIATVFVTATSEAARAADPTEFAIVAPIAGEVPKVSLKGEVGVRIDGDTVIDPKKVQLWIDGSPLLGVDTRLLSDRRELVFPLDRNEQNRRMWSRLLGSPFGNPQKSLPIGVQVGDKVLKWRDKPLADEAPAPMIKLVTYNAGLITLGSFIAVLVVVITIIVAARTTMMRDSVMPQMRLTDRPYSLGRLQMLSWFCLILGSFLFIFAVTWDLNSITTESFILLGISGSTALASVAIDSSRDGPLVAARTKIEALGIKTRDDAEKLYAAQQKDPTTLAQDVIPGATPNVKVGELWQTYAAAIAPFKSTTFLKDLVNDAAGPTIHRWQILIWTAVLGVIYVGMVYANLETPTFGTNLLALMGISGGVYLGFKIPEKQSTT